MDAPLSPSVEVYIPSGFSERLLAKEDRAETTPPLSSEIGGHNIEILSHRKFTHYSLAARIARFSFAIFMILLLVPLLGLPLLFKATRETLTSLLISTTYNAPIKLPAQGNSAKEFQEITLSLLPSVGSSFTLPFENIDKTDLAKKPPLERIQTIISQFIRDTSRNLPLTVDGVNLKEILDDLSDAEKTQIMGDCRSLTQERLKELKIYKKAAELCDTETEIADFLDLLHQGIFSLSQVYLSTFFARFVGYPISSERILSIINQTLLLGEAAPRSAVWYKAPFMIDMDRVSQGLDSSKGSYQASLEAYYKDDIYVDEGMEPKPYPLLEDIGILVTVTCDIKSKKGEITFTRISKSL